MPLEFRRELGVSKLLPSGLTQSVIFVILSSAVLIEHQLVMDGRTGGRTETHDGSIYRVKIASRGKKTVILSHSKQYQLLLRKTCTSEFYKCVQREREMTKYLNTFEI